ncbi:MAG: hypothetical protein ACRCXZ_09050 [Patescibacteria group bacterium]
MEPILRGNLFGLAGACAEDWQSEVVRTLLAQDLKVFNNQNPLFGLFSQGTDVSNEVYFTKRYCHTVLGVLLPNFPSAASCQYLVEYTKFFKRNMVLVIPDYVDPSKPEKGTEDFNHQKQVNTQRHYLIQIAENAGAKIFQSIPEALEYAIAQHTKWYRTIASLGACGKTTWRAEYFSPLNAPDHYFNHFNPQQDNWVPQMALDEQEAKDFGYGLFLNLNDLPTEQATLGLVSQDEVWFLADELRNVIVVYNPQLNENSISLVPERHRQDYINSRNQLITKLKIATSQNPYLKWVQTMEEGMKELAAIQANHIATEQIFAIA